MPINEPKTVFEAGVYTLLVDKWTRADGVTYVRGEPVALDRQDANRLGNADTPAIAALDAFQSKVARGEIIGDRVDLEASPEDLAAQIAALQARLDEKTRVHNAQDQPIMVPKAAEQLGNHGSALDTGGGRGQGHADLVAPDAEEAADEETRAALSGTTEEAQKAAEEDQKAEEERRQKAQELREKRAQERAEQAGAEAQIITTAGDAADPDTQAEASGKPARSRRRSNSSGGGSE